MRLSALTGIDHLLHMICEMGSPVKTIQMKSDLQIFDIWIIQEGRNYLTQKVFEQSWCVK